jgi:hypothetical protein
MAILENKAGSWDAGLMVTTKADGLKRIIAPQAKPGQVYAIHNHADGSFTLKAIHPAEPLTPTCSLVEEDGFAVAAPNQPIDEAAIRELLADFP